MKKYFVVSDVHSFYNELQTALANKDWNINNPDHIFVSLGDLLDRGPDAVKCLEFVNGLPDERKILILGNHEDLMVEAQNRKEFWSHDIHNGTNETCYQIFSSIYGDHDYMMNATDDEVLRIVQHSDIWNKYYNSCVNYAEVGDNIFVHGWIPVSYKSDEYGIVENVKNPKWRNASEALWRKARWFNGMEMWASGIREKGHTIWCGHWHASWGHANLHHDGVEFLKPIETYYLDKNGVQHPYAKFTPFEDVGIKCIDACTAYSGFVNCEVIEV